MKHLYLSIITILLLSNVCSAQTQTRFAAPGAKWCSMTQSVGGYSYNDPLYAVDSAINNIPCSYIAGLGCVYVQNDTVYNIRANGITEFLFDYGAQPGDRWLLYNLEYRSTDYDSVIAIKIDSVQKVIISGDTLRLIINHVDTLNGNTFNGYHLDKVLENVGPTRMTTFRPGPWGFWDGDAPYLQCYSDSAHGALNAETLQPLDSCTCRRSVGIDDIDEHNISIDYAANQQVINITLNQSTKGSASLYNLNGQQVLQTNIESSNASISTQTLTASVYFCTVAIEGYKPYTKKIIVLK